MTNTAEPKDTATPSRLTAAIDAVAAIMATLRVNTMGARQPWAPLYDAVRALLAALAAEREAVPPAPAGDDYPATVLREAEAAMREAERKALAALGRMPGDSWRDTTENDPALAGAQAYADVLARHVVAARLDARNAGVVISRGDSTDAEMRADRDALAKRVEQAESDVIAERANAVALLKHAAVRFAREAVAPSTGGNGQKRYRSKALVLDAMALRIARGDRADAPVDVAAMLAPPSLADAIRRCHAALAEAESMAERDGERRIAVLLRPAIGVVGGLMQAADDKAAAT